MRRIVNEDEFNIYGLLVVAGMAVVFGLLFSPKFWYESKLKPGDCVRKLGQPLIGKVHIISKDTIELYYEMANDQIIFDVANVDGVVKVQCELK